MLLVDTSIWIEFLKHGAKFSFSEDLIAQTGTCLPVIQEIFQGLKDSNETPAFKEYFLAIPRFSDPLPLEDYLSASEIFSFARKKGFTIRSSVDCLIAAIAIKNNLALWHKDRDFNTISKFTNLKIYQPK